ncbi:MAG: OmpA family protein, partial [Bacteroidota bacterium]
VQTPMNVRTKVKLSNGIELANNKTYLINPKLSRVNLLINSYDGKEYAILGLFDFDSSEFSLFDNRVREKVLDDLHYRGKKLTIIPFTDNIGSKEYNTKLAEKRALAAVQLLQLRDEDYKIEYPTQYLYDNRTPLGRILNRSVIIRIEK